VNRHSEVRDLEVSLEPRRIGFESAKEEDLKVNEEVIWLQVSEKRSGIERERDRDLWAIWWECMKESPERRST
jgi:hypothetical protein